MKRIVIVDDDSAIQDAFQLVFKPTEYEVVIYNSGEPLLNMDFELPDLIILDKQLSGVDGLDVCRFLKSQEQTKNIPVLMLSASMSIRQLAKNAGANDALEKPFKIKALREIASRLMAG